MGGKQRPPRPALVCPGHAFLLLLFDLGDKGENEAGTEQSHSRGSPVTLITEILARRVLLERHEAVATWGKTRTRSVRCGFRAGVTLSSMKAGFLFAWNERQLPDNRLVFSATCFEAMEVFHSPSGYSYFAIPPFTKSG